jgi:ABC-type uncharacterized transport system substrate-binding protein
MMPRLFSIYSPELMKKLNSCCLLKEVVLKLVRVAILGDRDHQNYNVQLKELEMAAAGLGLQLQPVQLRAADELENAFSAMARDRAGAFLVLSNPAIGFFRGKVVEFAAKARVPGMYATPAWVTGRLDVLCSRLCRSVSARCCLCG